MELRHLRYFVAVAEELHFTRAAERLHIAQPPLSQQIRALEEELGVQLLQRTRRSVALTDAGAAPLERARTMLAMAQALPEELRRIARGEAGELRIGFTSTLPLTKVLRDIVADHRRTHPEVLLTLRELHTAEQFEALRRGELDVVQMFEPYVSMASRAGAGEVLYAASSRGPTVYTTFLASHDSIRRNRAAFDAMVRAIRRSLAWVAEHSGEELADAVASYYPHVARELLASSLQRYHDANLWARTPELSRQGFARLADSMKSGGFISRLHAYEDCVDQSFATEA